MTDVAASSFLYFSEIALADEALQIMKARRACFRLGEAAPRSVLILKNGVEIQGSHSGQQKCHIQWKGEDLLRAADVVIAQFNGAVYMVFFRVVQNGFGAFSVACSCFYFEQSTLPFITNYKKGSFVSIEIAKQNIVLRAVFLSPSAGGLFIIQTRHTTFSRDF